MKGFMVAATHSGAGKTTTTLALLAAFRRRGLNVQSFKVGPDFIDPGHHACITGRPAHNLDGWMLSREENLDIFGRYAHDADVVVVEGVMGLYDGFSGGTEDGSSAQIAKWLGLPVLLCVDARSMARSMGAVALGFSRFDPELSWAGLLANRVGSRNHSDMLAEAMASVPDLPFLGGLSREPAIAMPERHLGLVTAEESAWDDDAAGRLADWIEDGMGVDAFLQGLPEIEPPTVRHQHEAASGLASGVRIGVARDEAFCFYYQENLRRLAEAGAELVFFSPLWDRDLPQELDGLYIGGGYPELFAEKLSGNAVMLASIRRFGLADGGIYAECGGFMYLTRTLTDLDGHDWAMAGLLPLEVRMLKKLRTLGYRETVLTGDTPLGGAGTRARGHEFHYSEICAAGSAVSSKPPAEVFGRGGRQTEPVIFCQGNTLAGYIHLHFGSNPDLAVNFVKACRKG